MKKKMPKKEEEFWKDLAFRMANHVGWTAREVVKRTRPNCSSKTKQCVVIDKTHFVWPFVLIRCKNWKDVVSALCSHKVSLYISRCENIFIDVYEKIRKNGNDVEKAIIELDLAGFGDLAEAIQKGKI